MLVLLFAPVAWARLVCEGHAAFARHPELTFVLFDNNDASQCLSQPFMRTQV